MQHSFDALIADLTSRGFKVGYSKVFKDEFFVVTASNDTTDAYIRYHQYGEGGLGFSLYWSHDAIDIHGERIATLISGSLWSAMSGAPFTEPFVLKPKDEIAVSLPPTLLSPAPQLTPPPVPAPALAAPPRAAAAEPSPASSAEQKPQEKSGGSSGTGFFVARDGLVLTNAHVVNECAQIRVAVGRDNILPADIVARDVANDLALLKINHTPVRVAQIRSNVRLGENVEAFGYPLTGLLATSGNFTLGNVAALAGLGDDSRYLQISAPVQPGNSGGPLLDQSGNVVGVVSAKLNAMKVMVATNGDIPENVNFAIKASVAANFLQTNSVKFEVGEASQQLQPADVADQAKAMSVYVQCQQR
jgi:S1-C subfamily serine protease